MKTDPLISVIIPTYNCASTIGAALQSILDQTYKNIEVIIVDDNSTDDTQSVIAAFEKTHANVHYYRLPQDDPKRLNSRGRNVNAGWAARNYAFTKTRGKWIAFQDADDASLLNRIETQYKLAIKYRSSHVATSWVKFDERYLGKKLDVEKVFAEHPDTLITTEEILTLAKKTRGIAFSLLGPLHQYVPFRIKTMRVVNKLFFGSLLPYPGTGHFMIKREVMEKVLFEPLKKRIWPTFVGRGADRDFNFRVALLFKDSVCFRLPIYLWRVPTGNPEFPDIDRYIID